MMADGHATLNSPQAPSRHLVDLNQVPLLAASRRRRTRSRCLSCLCHLFVAVASAIAGSAATLVGVALADLRSDNCTVPDPAPACPGVCAGRILDGRFTANVSRSKTVVGLTVVVKFHVEHTFSLADQTYRMRVIPQAFEPHWIPFSLRPIDCSGVPFVLSDNCTLSTPPSETPGSECLAKAFKADDITDMTLRWDATGQNGAGSLVVSESLKTGFFDETFVWTENRIG